MAHGWRRSSSVPARIERAPGRTLRGSAGGGDNIGGTPFYGEEIGSGSVAAGGDKSSDYGEEKAREEGRIGGGVEGEEGLLGLQFIGPEGKGGG